MQTTDEKKSRLEKWKRQREMIDNRIRQAEAREKSLQKKQDTRRKILIGAWMMDKLEKEGRGIAEIKNDLDAFLTRTLDRMLFDLPVPEDSKS